MFDMYCGHWEVFITSQGEGRDINNLLHRIGTSFVKIKNYDKKVF